MMNKTHHFFLLNLSPWPLLISSSSFNLFFSFFLFAKFGDFKSLFLCFFSIVLCSFLWWVSYSLEFNLEGKSSFNLEKGVKMSMILFISSEIFFFFSFFWAYFHFFLSPSLELGLCWPPVNVEFFDSTGVPLINTLVLMSSGLTVTLSHYFLVSGSVKNFNLSLLGTICLGGFFTFLQYTEYMNSFFSMSDGTFGTCFFVLTGFHGIHVLVGSFFLLTVLIRSGTMPKENCLSFELSAWYWHFVDVVWIFLYTFLYYLVC